MQRALIVYAHPNSQSLNHAILETVVAALYVRKAETRVRDLYAMKFDPVLRADELADRHTLSPDIAAAQADITWADTLVFIYPIWWMDRPAILKGWFDRVFTSGFAFTKKGEGLLGGRKVIVLQTAGCSAEFYGKEGEIIFHGAIGSGSLGYAGITDITAKTFYSVTSETDAARQEMLEEVRACFL